MSPVESRTANRSTWGWSPALLALGVWTVAMWTGRLRNIVRDDALVGGQRTAAFLTAAGFWLLGLCLLWAAFVRRTDLRWGTQSLRVIAAVTVVYWPIRAVLIMFDDHTVGFVVVHLVLAAVSVALSVWVLIDVHESSADAKPGDGQPAIVPKGSGDTMGGKRQGAT